MRKLGKKIAAFAMATVMMFSMAACGKDDKGGNDKSTNSDATGSQTDATGSASGNFDISIEEMSQLMGNGINLGNTMEATGRKLNEMAPSVSSCETAWGQPLTSKEIISGMKAAGFDSIRIPTAWANMMDYTNGDYTIATEYLDRIEEITKWAIEEDMYVIINDHWDNQWWGMFGDADQAVRDNAWKMYESMWTQIAERFKDYDQHVIFEGANEELGDRLNDDWKLGSTQTGTLTTDECYDTTNKINQKFVDIVRASGGNNAKRFLLVAGYNTDITKTCDDRFVMPTDTVEGKLFVSVHFYDPSDYCLFAVNTWGSEDEFKAANESLKKMKKFVDAGYGVIIGEYGALPKYVESGDYTEADYKAAVDAGDITDDGRSYIGEKLYVKQNSVKWNKNVLDNCDLYGYVPVLWDTNGLYNKAECKIVDEGMKELYASRSYAAQKDKTLNEIQTEANNSMKDAIENATAAFELDPNTAKAWIMFTSADWTTQYVVGDVYDPTGMDSRIKATDVEVTGEGTYTVALDFTGLGYASGTAFCALGLANGETLFPGYVIDIKEIKVNGETYNTIANGYTCSDDKVCTRVNIFNSWVSDGSETSNETARTASGSFDGCSAQIIDAEGLGNVETLEVTFDYIKK